MRASEANTSGLDPPHQAKLFEEGNAYLDREFPLLDKLHRATIRVGQVGNLRPIGNRPFATFAP